ncbi:MAG: hypothetical protein ACFFDX_06915 [Candidatus Odinarchaeota archaeon]
MYSIINKRKRINLNKFLDYDKSKDQFYENIYLKEEKFVLKIPLNLDEEKYSNIIIEPFDLTKHTYLVAY